MTLLEGFLWLALNIYHEGRSEPQIGQVAIAHVTLNRANQKNITIKDVIQQPHQFDWTVKKSYLPKNFPAFCQSMKSAYIALNSNDFTAGATHYHLQSINPDWSNDLTYIKQYGSHKFYR
jgi:N-acetylmuramoyl-L-alanine amidase